MHNVNLRYVHLPLRLLLCLSACLLACLICSLVARLLVCLPACLFVAYLFLKQVDEATARGFESLRAQPNGFRVHPLGHSGTLS